MNVPVHANGQLEFAPPDACYPRAGFDKMHSP